jgi:hypothetical protein
VAVRPEECYCNNDQNTRQFYARNASNRVRQGQCNL